MPSLTIDGQPVTVPSGATLVEAVQGAGLYVPALCAHPDLPPWTETEPWDSVFQGPNGAKVTSEPAARGLEACQLCMVEVEGEAEPVTACTMPATANMVVRLDTAEVQRRRREQISRLLAHHPHVCLTCPLRQGCSREPCALGIPVEERCCPKLGDCEIQRVGEYIGIPDSTPRYIPRQLPVRTQDPAMVLDYNLCIGCTLCVRYCGPVRGVHALGFVYVNGEATFGAAAPSLKEAKCEFCGGCVEVCPAGAIQEKREPRAQNWRAVTQRKLGLEPVPQPPKSHLAFDEAVVEAAPDREGVYQLFDAEGNTLCILGTSNLRQALMEQLAANPAAHSLRYEESALYTQRESELIQEYVHQHGSLPSGNELEDDLF